MPNLDKLPMEIQERYREDQEAAKIRELDLKDQMKEAKRVAYATVLIASQERLRASDPDKLQDFEDYYGLEVPRMPEYGLNLDNAAANEEDTECQAI